MMMQDLELLREIFKDVRLHIGIGTITQLGVANDKSVLRVQVRMLPDQREIVAIHTWEDVGASTGIICFPEVDDLVLVAFVDGHPDEAFVIRKISTSEEPLPTAATQGHMVVYAKPGKKLYLGSDTKIGLAKPGTEPSEPLVLGNVLKTFLGNVLDAFLNASQLGQCAVGPVALDPSIRLALTQYKAQYLTAPSTNILSQVVFTDRGI